MNAGRKTAESGRCHAPAKGDRHWKLTGKPQPRGDTLMNRNG